MIRLLRQRVHRPSPTLMFGVISASNLTSEAGLRRFLEVTVSS